MKRMFLLFILMLAVIACACISAIAGDIYYYGDYAYTLADGQAIIVGVYNGNGLDERGYWYDEDGEVDRPGMEDESARFPESIGGDGVWRTVVPTALDGYPVVAIDSFGLMSVRGDIVLPKSLTSIGASAFHFCYEAFAITVPASVTSIGDRALERMNPFENGEFHLSVSEGSYAEQYAQENEISYVYVAE